MDHQSELARQMSAELILQRIHQNVTAPERPLVVVLGDLNSREDQAAYQVLTGGRYGSDELRAQLTTTATSMVDLQKFIKLRSGSSGESVTANAEGLLSRTYGSNGTVTGFRANSTRSNIDHILVADNGAIVNDGGRMIRRFGVLPNRVEDGQYSFRSSDHNLVVAVLQSR